MRLKQITYIESGWSLKGLHFKEVSLIVGKNSVGKSKSIQALNQLVYLILQKKAIHEYDNFGYKICFEKKDSELTYSFAYRNGKVYFEHLFDNNKTYIKRNTNYTKFYEEQINPPENCLALNIRRDTILYTEIEEIIRWAENSYSLLFNRIIPGNDNNTSFFSTLSACEDLIPMFEKLNDNQKSNIVKELNNLNYQVDNLEIVKIDEKLKVLHIKEKNVRSFLWEGCLSQGMQRTLFILVFITYIASKKEKNQLLVIDDFSEGLDYDRSIKLGKYIYNFCIENNIQLITSSNDSFLMDVINLKYWNILQRDGEKVTAININNSPEIFNDFEFTGLSNFDLFSSDFITRHKK